MTIKPIRTMMNHSTTEVFFENLGAVLMFAATIVYIGRQQLLLVVKQMFKKPAADEAQGRYLPYSVAGWGFVLCTAGMIGWLMAAGVTFFGATVSVLMGGVLFLVIARVVAETGIMFVQLSTGLQRPWILMAQSPAELGSTMAEAAKRAGVKLA